MKLCFDLSLGGCREQVCKLHFNLSVVGLVYDQEDFTRTLEHGILKCKLKESLKMSLGMPAAFEFVIGLDRGLVVDETK